MISWGFDSLSGHHALRCRWRRHNIEWLRVAAIALFLPVGMASYLCAGQFGVMVWRTCLLQKEPT